MEECKHGIVGIVEGDNCGHQLGDLDSISSFIKWIIKDFYSLIGHPNMGVDFYSDEEIDEAYTFDWYCKHHSRFKYRLFDYCPICGEKLNVNDMQNEIYKRANEIILTYKPKSIEDFRKLKLRRKIEEEIKYLEWKESRRKPPINGYVYVLKMKDIYKIGMTQDPKRRVKELIKLPYDLEITICEYIKNYSIMEEKLHEHFKDKRLNGEWFNLNEQDLEYIKSELEKNKVPQATKD